MDENALTELRHVTVLFSDVSGYTAMSEKLDVEDASQTMRRVFSGASRIIEAHGGHIDKLIGDEAMALFGVPTAREDDALEAVRAALEIHEFVESLEPEFATRLDRPLRMHSGINTGLVVVAEASAAQGTEKVLGDTVNLAARLTALAGPGQVVVGEDTYRLTERDFAFEPLPPAALKGKELPVHAYRVLAAKEREVSVHRLTGLRSRLIGRERELATLEEAVTRLMDGVGGAILVTGDAGAGKSRLTAEYRASLGERVRWLEGRCYPHSQDMAYFPFVDLLGRTWEIADTDSAAVVRSKVHQGLWGVTDRDRVEPFVGALFGLDHPGLEGVEPKRWKSETEAGIRSVLATLARQAPTLVHLEDLHWADRASLGLLRTLLETSDYPVLFVCSLRPSPALEAGVLGAPGPAVERIALAELTPAQSREMLGSLLASEEVPEELSALVYSRAEGNPFYVEEVVNHLIERDVLVRERASWTLARPVEAAGIPTTVQGVIAARIDNLPSEEKRVLQQASVIGRRFGMRILQAVAEGPDVLAPCLADLQERDLIRVRATEPELEYTFKHAVTQEVVYDGLLKTERKAIHEKVGCAIEELFPERIPDLVETLAFHFERDSSPEKAIDYLMRAGEKAFSQYALDDANAYFGQAFALLSGRERTPAEDELLVGLIERWANVYWHRGDNVAVRKLLEDHLELAASLDDRTGLGKLSSLLGESLWASGRPRESYEHLHRALRIAQELGDPTMEARATGRLVLCSWDLGLRDEAWRYADRALELSSPLKSDRSLYSWTRITVGHVYQFTRNVDFLKEFGEDLLSLGERFSDSRCLSVGCFELGVWSLMDGDYLSAIDYFARGARLAPEPVYSLYNRCLLGVSYIEARRWTDAERTLGGLVNELAGCGHEWFADQSRVALGPALVALGRMDEGMRMTLAAGEAFRRSGRVTWCAGYELYLGYVYRELASGGGWPGLPTVVRNLGFLVRNLPFAARRSEAHFKEAIRIADDIGATTLTAQATLSLGELVAERRGRTAEARVLLVDAVRLFDEVGNRHDRAKAQEILDGLNPGR